MNVDLMDRVDVLDGCGWNMRERKPIFPFEKTPAQQAKLWGAFSKGKNGGGSDYSAMMSPTESVIILIRSGFDSSSVAMGLVEKSMSSVSSNIRR